MKRNIPAVRWDLIDLTIQDARCRRSSSHRFYKCINLRFISLCFGLNIAIRQIFYPSNQPEALAFSLCEIAEPNALNPSADCHANALDITHRPYPGHRPIPRQDDGQCAQWRVLSVACTTNPLRQYQLWHLHREPPEAAATRPL